MATYMYFVFAMLLMFVCDQKLVRGACTSPTEAETAAKSCLNNVGLNLDTAAAGGTMGAAGDVEQLKRYCKDKAMDAALTCVQNIIDGCKKENAQASSALGNLLNVEQLRSAFKSMCDNVNILEENVQCIAKQAQPVATCVQSESEKFQKELQAKQQSGQMKQDDMPEMTCRFMDDMIACQENVFKAGCGAKVAEFMISFTQAIKPPMCAKYSNGASSVIFSSTGIFTALFLAVLLHFNS